MMAFFRAGLFLLLLSVVFPVLTFARPQLFLPDAQNQYPPEKTMHYLEDPTTGLTIDDVVSPEVAEEFKPCQTDTLNFGFTKSVYWVRLRLTNKTLQTTDWVLKLGRANMQRIDFYRPRANRDGFDVVRTGTDFPFVTRDISYHRFAFNLSLPPDAEKIVYLRFQCESSMTILLSLLSKDAFARYKEHSFFFSGLFYGAMALLIVYNLFLWAALRNNAYGYYVGWLTSLFIVQLAYEGFFAQYLWPDAPRWNDFSILFFWALVPIFLLMFTQTFLNTRKRTPRAHWGIIILLSGAVLITALIPFVGYQQLVRVTVWQRIINFLFCLGLNTVVWRQGYRPVRYFFPALLMSFLPAVFFCMVRIGFLPSSWAGEHGHRLGVVLTGLFFSFALADRIQTLRREKDAAQNEALTALRDQEQMIAGQNILLEQKVAERTVELKLKISEQQKTEGELKLAKEQAESANTAKSQFLSNMSHELRTPLTAILGYAQLLKKEIPPCSTQATGLETIERSGSHLVQLIEDLLDLARIENKKNELNRAEFSLKKCINSLAGMIRLQAAQKGLNFEYDQNPDLPDGVLGDEKRLSQVLLNLLGNAVKFTDHGDVRLTVTPVGSERLQGESSSNPPESVCRVLFSIGDTGQGIPQEELEHIFSPFVQLKNKSKNIEGIGLGLPICRHFVTLMGGELDVTSAIGTGSTFQFTLTLPVVSHTRSVTKKTEAQIVGIQGTPPRILIVDDHADNRAMLSHNLKSMGFLISEAENGQDGIEKAKQEKPDLVMMDLMMPVTDGFDATRMIRSLPSLAGMKIIIMTANVTVSPEKLISEIGCDAVLHKPLSFGHLEKELKSLLGAEWIYAQTESKEEADNRKIVFPSSAELHKLRRLANLRLFTELTEELENMSHRDKRYTPFATRLLLLLNKFQFDAILQQIDMALTA